MRARIRDAARCLSHRGPDQQGFYESQRISLGVVRLQIVDLEAGSQPMVSPSGDTVLLFNGELYNHAELRQTLEALGHSFRTKSDTEVALKSFLQWDTSAFERFRGMFALAVWEESKSRLVLARDRMGIKPLYFHRQGHEIYFGSEMKTLFVHPEVGRQLDPEALEYYLSLNYVPGPMTLVKGIEKLPAGHFLEWADGRLRTRCYWKLDISPKPARSLEDSEGELDQLLRQSIREHLMADVDWGVWLSGGVDSSTILHYASQETSRPVKTFSVSFAGRSFDETRYFRDITKRYQTEHYEIDVNPSLDLPAALEDLVYHCDEPLADAGAVPVWYLSKLTRQHATVALSGEGADELFGGYITYRADHLAKQARRFPQSLLRRASTWASRLPISDDKISFEYKLKRFLAGAQMSADIAHTYWNGTFSASQQRELLTNKNGTCVSHLYDEAMPAAGSLNRYLAFDQRYYLTDDILQKVDRMSMAHSVEVRPPFLDHRIVEFAAGLPENFKIRGNRHKVLLKSLMTGKLPISVLRRPKTGLDVPTHDWLRGALKPLLLDTLTPGFLRGTGLFQEEYVGSLIREHMQRRANLGYHLWGLLILSLWIKKWNIETRNVCQESPHFTEMAEAQAV